MPSYRFVGDSPKALVDTTPPHEVLNPGDTFEVAEDLNGDQFERVDTKPAKAKAEDITTPKEDA